MTTPTNGTDATSSSSGTPSRLRRGRAAVVPLLAVLALTFGVMWGTSAQRLAETRTDLEATTARVADLSTETNSLNQALTDLERDLASRDAEMSTATDALAEDRAEVRRKRKALTAREGRLDERVAELDAREEAVTEVEEAAPDLDLEPDLDLDLEGSGASGSFDDIDRDYLIGLVDDLIEDIVTVDERLPDGIGVGGALGLLSGTYGRMATSQAPPSIAERDYFPRLDTLQTFADDAASLYSRDPLEATAKYAVIRQETQPLLDLLNEGLGTSYDLP